MTSCNRSTDLLSRVYKCIIIVYLDYGICEQTTFVYKGLDYLLFIWTLLNKTKIILESLSPTGPVRLTIVYLKLIAFLTLSSYPVFIAEFSQIFLFFVFSFTIFYFSFILLPFFSIF